MNENITEEKIEKLKKIKESAKNKSKKEIKKEKKSDKEVIAELTETLQRLQAEFENYKKRVEREKEEFLRYAKADLITKLLPILDSFELALKNTSDKEKFIKGVELIFAQLHSLLESEGLKPIKAVGEKFDPYKHEVLMKQKSDKDEDIILEELQKGYMLNDKVLRHSKVKVSKKEINDKKSIK
jgi:molecular chaperone GrpE